MMSPTTVTISDFPTRTAMKILVVLALVCASCTARRLTIDEVIAGASKVKNLNYLTDLDGNTFMQELDMVLTLDQWRALREPYNSRKKRKAIRDTRYRWTNRSIPYKMAPNVFNGDDLDEIKKAMDEWEKYTCLKFTEATSHENFVYFDDASGCYSYVGMTGGSQTIGLAGGCRHIGVIAHEIGHAVGFHHEQNRPDRDNHVRIIEENIPSSVLYNFRKYPVDAVNTYDVPYDYGSVMHYGGRAFSQNGQLTIQTLNSADQNKIGNREGLSFHDIKLANLMYSCNSHCSTAIKCPDRGFMGRDCRCYCPGSPVQSCDAETGTEGATEPPTEAPEVTSTPCLDMNDYCGEWAEGGYCGSYTYLQLYCKKSCDLCERETTQPPCQDEKEHCEYWRDEGFCTGDYESFMREHCKKSCSYCESSRSSGDIGGNGGSRPAGTSGVWSLLCLLSVAMVCLSQPIAVL